MQGAGVCSGGGTHTWNMATCYLKRAHTSLGRSPDSDAALPPSVNNDFFKEPGAVGLESIVPRDWDVNLQGSPFAL